MMRDTVSANDVLKKAHSVGQYYGFVPFSTLAARARGSKPAKAAPNALAGLALDPTAEVIANLLRQCREAGCLPSARAPLFLWHTNITPGRAAPKKAIVQFHAIGSDRPIADAVVIRALSALVRDLFREEPALRVNSMGDKETRARYARELGNYFKKRAATLPEECVTCAKRDAIEAAELTIERSCAEDLPAPTDHLSDASRKRFEDLLEFLEATETPYDLSRDLITRGSAWSDTCFELTVGGQRAAWGSRYTELTRHFFPGALPATGGILELTTEGGMVTPPPSPRLRFSFVHIGDEAKRLSIRLAEDFRHAHVPLAQDIGLESLTEQLHVAERRSTNYLLVMGRKEALESSVIVRNRMTQDESVLPIAGIVDRLKTFA